eukprot:SAG11_NODE_592_length_8310_cov_3.191868_3_plen_76_part_00
MARQLAIGAAVRAAVRHGAARNGPLLPGREVDEETPVAAARPGQKPGRGFGLAKIHKQERAAVGPKVRLSLNTRG